MTGNNAENFSEAWSFFKEHARNVTKTPLCVYGKYSIPKPDRSGEFIYADDPGVLFQKFREEFYKPSLESESTYGKIQAIVKQFK